MFFHCSLGLFIAPWALLLFGSHHYFHCSLDLIIAPNVFPLLPISLHYPLGLIIAFIAPWTSLLFPISFYYSLNLIFGPNVSSLLPGPHHYFHCSLDLIIAPNVSSLLPRLHYSQCLFITPDVSPLLSKLHCFQERVLTLTLGTTVGIKTTATFIGKATLCDFSQQPHGRSAKKKHRCNRAIEAVILMPIMKW